MKKHKILSLLILFFSLESHATTSSTDWNQSQSLSQHEGQTIVLKQDITLDQIFDLDDRTFYTNSESLLVEGRLLHGELGENESLLNQDHCTVSATRSAVSSLTDLSVIPKGASAVITDSRGEYGTSWQGKHSWVDITAEGDDFNFEITCYLYESSEIFRNNSFLALVNKLIELK